MLAVAAVEGRRFRRGTIADVVAMPASDLEASLATLDRRGFVSAEDETGSTWRFTHSLVWEAAYLKDPEGAPRGATRRSCLCRWWTLGMPSPTRSWASISSVQPGSRRELGLYGARDRPPRP